MCNYISENEYFKMNFNFLWHWKMYKITFHFLKKYFLSHIHVINQSDNRENVHTTGIFTYLHLQFFTTQFETNLQSFSLLLGSKCRQHAEDPMCWTQFLPSFTTVDQQKNTNNLSCLLSYIRSLNSRNIFIPSVEEMV